MLDCDLRENESYLVMEHLVGESLTGPRLLDWQSVWRTGWLVFAIASAGAISALVSQVLLSRLAFGTPPAHAVGGSGNTREIVLRIRVDSSPSDPPTVAVESDGRR